MELYHQILLECFSEYFLEHGYPGQNVDAVAIVHDKCYQTLCQIKRILEDETLEDPDCFWKIEEIVCVLEKLGTDAGTRHDFG